ncbi:MAG: hypothetical protein UX89_C0014G0024 [Parcubacteria group bacterium GW2011_GWA2_47_16]|nr:MAG: hypothetical protein UX89_C0014G0024 [Parcubacteria group bacterium GW2011_GWA2_47_16]
MIRKITLVAFIVVVVAVGGYAAFREYGFRALSRVFDERLKSGDYLAAIGAAGKLKEGGVASPELDDKVSSAARMLLADEAFKKAKQASGEKRFSDAGAILRASDAITEPAFKYYEEAKKLYDEVEALAAGAAHKTAVTINSLENQAAAEKTKRAVAEKQTQKLEGSLKEREATLSETTKKLEASKQETEVKQSALVAEQNRAKALLEQIEKEVKQKFFTELKTYRDLAQKGKEQVENALTEIIAKRDVTALVYLSQGKILFEETKNKTTDLKNNRTVASYRAAVEDLTNALSQLLESSKQLRNAIVYIEEQGGADFVNAINKGKAALASGAGFLSSVSNVIAANP